MAQYRSPTLEAEVTCYYHVMQVITSQLLSEGAWLKMEDFSEEQRANALSFVQTYVSKYAEAESNQLKYSRSHFTVEELEGECLQMARTFLSQK